MFERATREKRMSPMMATCRPAILPFFSRIVKVSRRACVGCSCAPSPALMMLASSRSARNWDAPAELCRLHGEGNLERAFLKCIRSDVDAPAISA